MDARINELDELIGLLTDWAEWMRHVPGIGYASRVPVFATGMGSSTFEELLEQGDGQAMRAVDASVASLPPANKAAIYRRYEICAVWRFPRPDYTYEQALQDAHEQLTVTLRRKGVIV